MERNCGVRARRVKGEDLEQRQAGRRSKTGQQTLENKLLRRLPLRRDHDCWLKYANSIHASPPSANLAVHVLPDF
jgi:hypothetical protein